jgi:hypothetical protein
MVLGGVGPFFDNLESLPCVREEREMQKGKAYALLDVKGPSALLSSSPDTVAVMS